MTLPTVTPTLANVDPQSGKLALSLHEMLSAPDPQGSVSEDESNGQQKRNFQPYHAQSVPKSENLEAHATERGGNAVTTVMLRNIPNKYTQNTLLQEINEVGFEGTYNFFYLPMDVHNRSNVGYAFINFERPPDAERFRCSFSDHRFQRFHSRKIGSVCIAHVQGLDENLRHFENRAVTQARNDQYRPIVLKGQRRIDFDDAVAEAKARIAQRERVNFDDAVVEAKARIAQREVQQEEAPSPACKPTSNVHKSESPVSERMIGGSVEHSKVMPSVQLQGPNDARQGLEAAIRDLLASSPAASTAASSSASPAGSFDVTGGVPKSSCSQAQATSEQDVNGAAMPHLQQGANITGYSPSLYGTSLGCQDDVDSDVAQLLSLRSLLVDRLLQKNNQAMSPNMNGTMPTAWGLAPPPGIDMKTDLKGPRSMNYETDAFAYDNQWCTL